MLQSWGIAIIYAFTIAIGVFGNTWVAISVIRTRKPRSTMGLSPSDRLRSYIGLLAVVDLLVISALFIKFIHVILPDVPIRKFFDYFDTDEISAPKATTFWSLEAKSEVAMQILS